MSYCVTILINNVVIPKEKIADCLKAINELHTPENLRKNKASGGDGKDLRYAWVDNPRELGFSNGFPTLTEAINAWNYEVFHNEDGSIALECYDGKKWGDDEVLYKTIAPFVRDGGEIEVIGESGAGGDKMFVCKTHGPITATEGVGTMCRTDANCAEFSRLIARAEKAEAERDEAREAFVDLARKVQDLAIETGKVSWSTPETKENK